MGGSTFNDLPLKDRMLVGSQIDGTTQYAKATGLDLSSNTDYTPPNGETMNALIITAGAGDIDVTFENGGRAVIGFTTAANDAKEIFRSYRIVTIHGDTTTTYSGNIYPIF